ncbi:MAG: sulfotransferase [Deltaproteobacteria bacterium]|nr:sulfotransferase [Deltaproteobacteria bacterium]
MPHFVFVGGVARSGTTLLQRILTRHALIAGGTELRVGHHLMGVYRLMKSEPHSGLLRGLYSSEDLRDAFRGFYERILRSQLEKKPGARWISEKSAGNVLVAHSLLELFPEARFVHIERDPRDVLASTMDVRDRASTLKSETDLSLASTRSVVRMWQKSARLSHSLRDHPRYTHTTYEALVDRPEATIRRILEFLDVPFDPELLRVNQESSAFADPVFHTQAELLRSIDRAGVGRYRSDLSWMRRWYVEAALGPAMITSGYSGSPVARASRGAQRLSRGLRRRLWRRH